MWSPASLRGSPSSLSTYACLRRLRGWAEQSPVQRGRRRPADARLARVCSLHARRAASGSLQTCHAPDKHEKEEEMQGAARRKPQAADLSCS